MYKIIKKLETSLILNLIFTFFGNLSSYFKKSFFFNKLTAEDKLSDKFRKSFFFSIIDKLISYIHRITDKISADFKSGFFYSLISKSAFFSLCRFEILVSALIFVMLLIPHKHWNNLYGIIIAAILLIAYLFKQKKNSCGASLWLLLFTIAIAGGILITPSLSEGLRGGAFMFSAIIFLYVIKQGITEEKSLYILIYTLTAGLFLISAYAIFQMFAGVETEELLTDIVNNKGMPGRVYSTLENPNNFAEVIVLLTPFAGAMFFINKNPYVKACMAFVIITAVSALLMTYSRGCYVSFAISVVIFLMLYKPKWLVPLFLAGILAIPFMPESIINRILSIGSTKDTSNAFRIFLWDGVFKLLGNKGLTGIGIGADTFNAAYAPFAHRYAASAPHSHMLYTEVFLELGVIGGISFFSFMYSSLRKGVKVILKNKNPIIIAAISAFGGISFSAATEYIWFYPRVMFVFFIVLGILLSSTNREC